MSKGEIRLKKGSKKIISSVLAACLAVLPAIQVHADENDKFLDWEKEFSLHEVNQAHSIIQTKDGGFITVGKTIDTDKNISSVYVVKLSSAGKEEWSKTYGQKYAEGKQILQTKDGGYIIVGSSSVDHTSYSDIYLVKIGKTGKVVWEKTFGDTYTDLGMGVVETKDGGFLVTGSSCKSKDSEESDGYVVKVDKNGKKLWDTSFRDEKTNIGLSAVQTKDGKYMVMGRMSSPASSEAGAYLLKLSSQGKKEWDKTVSIKQPFHAGSIQLTADGGFVIAGKEISNKGEDTKTHLIKTDATGDVEWRSSYEIDGQENPGTVQQTQDKGYIVAGTTGFTDSSRVYVLKVDPYGYEQSLHLVGDDAWGSSIAVVKDGGYIVSGWTTDHPGSDKGKLYVAKLKVDMNELEISHPDLKLREKDTVDLIGRAVFTDGSTKDITKDAEWKTSNNKVLTVSKGKITAKKSGDATITLNYKGQKVTKKVHVDPYLKVKELSVDKPLIVANSNVEIPVTVKAVYENGKTEDVTSRVDWTIKNDDIALIEAGIIKIKQAGGTKVTATYGSKSVSLAVMVDY